MVNLTSKLLQSVAVLGAIAVTVALCWPKPRGYTYQGKTVEEWFEQIIKHPTDTNALRAFVVMNTNATSFLASRVVRDLTPSSLESWSMKLPPRFHLTSKRREAETASNILGMISLFFDNLRLRELLQPALLGTNAEHLDRARAQKRAWYQRHRESLLDAARIDHRSAGSFEEIFTAPEWTAGDVLHHVIQPAARGRLA